ncbi:hypothetical protein LSAT2_007246, partial [Lamellibrachia satsuma]
TSLKNSLDSGGKSCSNTSVVEDLKNNLKMEADLERNKEDTSKEITQKNIRRNNIVAFNIPEGSSEDPDNKKTRL